MNYQALAAALHALADALVSQSPSSASTPAVAAVASMPAPVAAAAPKPRGRPPKGVEGAPAAPAAAPATPAVSAPAATPAPVSAAAASGLTHAQLVPAFKAAAVAHGAEFVRGLLKTHGAATFDKVKDLDLFGMQLKAGPVAAPAANAVDDLLG